MSRKRHTIYVLTGACLLPAAAIAFGYVVALIHPWLFEVALFGLLAFLGGLFGKSMYDLKVAKAFAKANRTAHL